MLSIFLQCHHKYVKIVVKIGFNIYFLLDFHPLNFFNKFQVLSSLYFLCFHSGTENDMFSNIFCCYNNSFFNEFTF